MKSTEYDKIRSNIEIIRKNVLKRSSDGNNHYHNACELHYFLKGTAGFLVHDQIYRIKKGDILFINTFEMHHSTPVDNEYEKILLTYKPSFIESLSEIKCPDILSLLDKKFNGERLISLPSYLQQRVESIFRDMMDASEQGDPYTKVLLQAHLILLLTYIAQYLSTTDIISNRHMFPDQKISRIISYLESHLSEPLSLDRVCNHFFTSKSHLCRYFKKHTGLSVIEYLNRIRILSAEKLIAQNKHSITNICFMVGFNNLTHFERTFKQLTGMTPSNYKKSLLSQLLL